VSFPDICALPYWYQNRYRFTMAVNVRMNEELAGQLRELAEETGRSQQDLIRDAIAEYIRNYKLRNFPPEIRHMLTPGKKASPEAMALPRLTLPPGVTSESLIAEGRGWRDA
jgi:predicted DNA-binding protein